MRTNKEEYFKRHNTLMKGTLSITKDSLSKSEIAKISKIPKSILDEVEKRGEGAYSTNPESVRTKGGKKDSKAPLSKKMSMQQWSMSRIYSFVNKMEGRRKLNHDTDLAEKVSWYKK